MAEQRTVDTGIVQRGNTYRFTVAVGMNSAGRQIRKTTTWTPPADITTQKKADKLAKEAYIDYKNRVKGLSTFDENMRFRELTELYFELYAPNKLKDVTAYNYKLCVNRHFIDYFGNKKLKEITTGMLTAFFSDIKKIDADGNAVPVKHTTLKRYFACMESIFTFAEHQHFIRENPCNSVILPDDKDDDAKKMYVSDDELPEFLALFEGYSPLNTIVKLLLFTGLRAGEALGLQWTDVDFEQRIISVNHTLSDVGGKFSLTSPKTKTSKRQIAMSDTVYALLKEQQARQTELRFAVGFSFSHPEMVFTSASGNYKSRGGVNTGFKRRLKNTKFADLTLHCLRHTNATLLLNSGVDLKIVSEHLGHADVSITSNVYVDVLESSKRKTAQIIEFALKQA